MNDNFNELLTIKDLFYKPLKIKGKETDILFWGCPHIDHDPKWPVPIWEQRGYTSVAEYKQGWIDNWNSRANANTIGFLLGDTMFGSGGAPKLKEFLTRITFKELYLLPGNHYACWHQLFTECEENVYEFSGKRVIFLPNYVEAFINGYSVVLSHYPILSFNGQGKGTIHLFAHVHGKLIKSEVGKAYLNSGVRALETSVEVNPYPINFSEVKRKLVHDKIVSFDHHGKDTQNPF